MEIGTMLRTVDGVPAFFKMEDGWYRWGDNGGWLWEPLLDDASAERVCSQFALTASTEPKFKTYEFQAMPDLNVPRVYEPSGEVSQAMHEMLRLLERQANSAWELHHRGHIDAGRVASLLDASCANLKAALAITPTNDANPSDVWNRLTNIHPVLNEQNRYESRPYRPAA